jgi:hypothetical protein
MLTPSRRQVAGSVDRTGVLARLYSEQERD